ncbi:protein EARLY FLOWERING 3 [Ricinus communis]|uniref:Uncharacterized protein n=1 Tax=Ricinus communis TaxID=3988 RepID=B9RRW1_RICCO|nr:protein EARLY FLOWERING 3 [Ricinus communis]XP_048227614.1 protein EARLY FLOWERING 3 [Ricinus communis]EEF45821.1 conserved hypothetical protein [Ricinus communis]|eukprot:XP_002516480.1 protein EARLY FLOWERING 3 [Ricinus communis]
MQEKMKRGKDDEKMMGPMFPRLHVNDTDKGGPRAPPRNKMALYEQLSIPSQRFNNHGALLHNPSKATNLVPAASSSQGSGYERNLHLPLHVPPSTHSHLDEKLHSRQPDGGNSNAASAQIEQRKKKGDEDDFRVPVFLHSGMGQSLGKTQSGIDMENSTSFGQNYLGHSTRLRDAGDKDQKNNISRGPNLRQDARNQSKENLEACVSSRGHSVRSFTSSPSKELMIVRPEDASPSQQNLDDPVASSSSLCENDVCLQQEASAALLQQNDSGHDEGVPELTRELEKGNGPQPMSDSHSTEDLNSPNEPEIDSEHHGDRSYMSVQFGNGDKSDDVSEISMLDSVSALDVSPDDVVGIIGQKHFWKARRAIVSQQRLFAVQVFELHRLIKVQRLIAGSPHLLLEESTYLGKPSMKVSPAKKPPSENVVTPPVHVSKRKYDPEKLNHNMEYSAENAVGKFSSVKNGSQPSNCGPYTGNPKPVPVAADSKMAPWCFQHSLGHQWLVPVMSPSEGLVYKPYAAPGFMGSVCGGCRPFGPSPVTGNFMDPTYGVPASHHPHQGTMPMPGVPALGHGYFPPYGMPIMSSTMPGSAVEQMNYYGQAGQLSGGGANIVVQHPSLQLQKSGSIPRVNKPRASKDTELRGSTASSPSERVQGAGNAQAAETRDPLPLFPTAPIALEGATQPQLTNQPRGVIKVVPHNRRSATESAARIFQSIQEERKQNDTI